ncbi:MAG: hypothetical protein J0665_15300 [Deltaproteobacteria bacterium]|nr:hypothetical protein [Deltaproteobacteria bacterium]
MSPTTYFALPTAETTLSTAGSHESTAASTAVCSGFSEQYANNAYCFGTDPVRANITQTEPSPVIAYFVTTELSQPLQFLQQLKNWPQSGSQDQRQIVDVCGKIQNKGFAEGCEDQELPLVA